jgi:glycosyltransferase involved in cell wall biosynthesis
VTRSSSRPAERALRIALVEFLPAGGVYQFALLMGEALARAGHDVELITPPDPEVRPREPRMTHVAALGTWRPAAGAIPPGMRFVREAQNLFRYGMNWIRVIGHLRRTRPDVAQFADFVNVLDGVFSRYVRWRGYAGAFVDLAHDPIPLEERSFDGPLYKSSRVLRRGLNLAYASMDVILVLGPYAKSQLVDGYRGLERIEVIPHGSYHGYHKDDPTPASEAPPAVLFFGTWSRYKGLAPLLDAFALVREQLPEATLVVAGNVSNDVDPAALAARARSIGNVEIYPGYVPVDEVPALFARCRLCVVPYIEATQSGIVHLAFTFARPVVATDVGDLAEVVHTDENGILVPPHDPVELSRALLALLVDPQRARRLGDRAHAWVATESSWDSVAPRLISIYRDALARADHRRRDGRPDGA